MRRSASLRLLLAEDNAVNQRLAVRLLEKRGHHAVVAGNGAEAPAALEKRQSDLVFTDVPMPETDGLEATVVTHDKATAIWLPQPIIALTAHAMTIGRFFPRQGGETVRLTIDGEYGETR